MYDQGSGGYGAPPQPPPQPQPQPPPQPGMVYPYPPTYAPPPGGGLERNILTILKVLAWGGLAVGIIAALVLCGTTFAQASEVSRSGANSTNVWLTGIVSATQLGLTGLLMWGLFTALGLILENQMKGRK